MRTCRIVSAAVALLTLPVLAAAQSSAADSIAVVNTLTQFHAALTAGDSSKAVSLLADDLIVVEGGAIETRAQYLGSHLGADMRASAGARGERTLLKVTVVGNAAYLVSRTVTPPAAAGGQTSESAELMVLSKTGAGWKISAVHWSSRRRR